MHSFQYIVALTLIIVSLGDGIANPGSGSPEGKEMFRRHTQEQKVVVAISFNEKFCMDSQDYLDLTTAIREATERLRNL